MGMAERYRKGAKKRLLNAAHAAAHVVVAKHHGLHVSGVDLGSGATIEMGTEEQAARVAVAGVIIGLLEGEGSWTGIKPDPACGERDAKAWAAWAGQVGERAEAVRHEVEDVLIEQQKAVQSLANALAETGQLDERGILEAVESDLGGGPLRT